MTAAVLGCPKCVQKHIDEAGKKDDKGMTALLHAAKQGYDDIVRVLAEKEAGMKDEDGWTALMFAAYNGHLECVKVLAGEEEEREVSRFTDLMLAALYGDTEGVQQHIDQAGQEDACGWTALMAAA